MPRYEDPTTGKTKEVLPTDSATFARYGAKQPDDEERGKIQAQLEENKRREEEQRAKEAKKAAKAAEKATKEASKAAAKAAAPSTTTVIRETSKLLQRTWEKLTLG